MTDAPSTPPRAVAVDFNGTLSDDEHLLERLFRERFAERGIAVEPGVYWRELAGLSDPEIAARGLALGGHATDPALVEEIVAAKVAAYRAHVAVHPLVPAAAAAFVRAVAARVPVAVVSGAERAEVETVLEAAGLREAFAAVVCAEDVRRGKPDPEGYRLALTALGAPRPADVVALEDSIPGLRAARAAGLRCLGVAGTADPAALADEADGVVERLDEALAERLLAA